MRWLFPPWQRSRFWPSPSPYEKAWSGYQWKPGHLWKPPTVKRLKSSHRQGAKVHPIEGLLSKVEMNHHRLHTSVVNGLLKVENKEKNTQQTQGFDYQIQGFPVDFSLQPIWVGEWQNDATWVRVSCWQHPRYVWSSLLHISWHIFLHSIWHDGCEPIFAMINGFSVFFGLTVLTKNT